jgi:hypothetical protein
MLAKLDDAGLSPSDRQIVRYVRYMVEQVAVSVATRRERAA